MSLSRGRLSRFIVPFSSDGLPPRVRVCACAATHRRSRRDPAPCVRRRPWAGRHGWTRCGARLHVRAWMACAFFALAPQALAQQGDTGHLSLDQAVEVALAANPQLAAAAAHAEALQAVPSQARALPDPVLGLNAMNLPTDSFNLRQEPMTQIQLSVSQMIPYPGKRRLMADAAGFEATAGLARAEDARLELAGQVRAAWWRLFHHDRALEIIDQNTRLMRDVIQIAQARYEVGGGLQQDVLLAQLELSRLLERELRLNGMRSRAEAALGALLDRPAGLIGSRCRPNPATSCCPIYLWIPNW